MTSRKRKHGKHAVQTVRGGRGGNMPIILIDRSLPDAGAGFAEWCRQHTVVPRQGWRTGPVKTRYMVMAKTSRNVTAATGGDDLATLVRDAWPVLTGGGLGPGPKVATFLSEDDLARYRQWMTDPLPPSPMAVAEPAGSKADTVGRVLLEPWSTKPFPEQERRSMMLSIGEALLVACGIEPPPRAPAPGAATDLMRIPHVAVVGDAIVEQALGGGFGEDGDAFTVLLGTYVLPVGDRRCLVRVAVTLVNLVDPPHSAEIDSVSFDWVGMDRSDAQPLWEAVAKALEQGGYAGDWEEPESQNVKLTTMFEWAARQLNQFVRVGRDLDAARKAAAKREAVFEGEKKRIERRWRDRESALVLERDAARAAVERERKRRLEAQLSTGPSIPDTTAVAVPVDDAARARMSELERRCEELQARSDDYAEQLDALRQALHAVESERDAALAVLDAPPAPVADALKAPSTLAELGGWAHRALVGRVVLVPRALRAARKSNFADPGLVYRALEALRDLYWEMKFGAAGGAQEAWKRFLRNEHLSCGHVGTGPESRLAETYHVSWDGRRLPLDMHLQGHSGRDATRQFRLYWHCDEAARLIVIGHLPSHLPNRAT